jgi:hypothetical protein
MKKYLVVFLGGMLCSSLTAQVKTLPDEPESITISELRDLM